MSEFFAFNAEKNCLRGKIISSVVLFVLTVNLGFLDVNRKLINIVRTCIP